MPDPLPPKVLATLQRLMPRIRRAHGRGDADFALELLVPLKRAFASHKDHFRFLNAQLWIFETCLDASHLSFAESGFIGIRRAANGNTRVYMEATGFLAVCYLRMKRPEDAKPLIRETLAKIDNIQKPHRRRQYQRRFVERLEDETILADLIREDATVALDPSEIEKAALALITSKSDREILQLLGHEVPASTILRLQDVRRFVAGQMHVSGDVKCLPAPIEDLPAETVGTRVFSMIGRICWRTLCAEDSPVFKAWNTALPDKISSSILPAAVSAAFKDYNIASMLLAAGVTATAAKYAALEFCTLTKPKGLMIGPREVD